MPWTKEQRAEYMKQYRIKNAERIKETNKFYAETNKERYAANRRAKWAANKEVNAVARREAYQEWRDKALNHLGGKCARCNFDDKRALQIDHVNGGGLKEYKKLNGGGYAFLKKVWSTEPGIEYQCLCANCNWIKRAENNEVAFPLVR